MQTLKRYEAANASQVFASLDQFKTEIKSIAASQNVSQVLILTILKDWCDRQLKSDINEY